MKTLKDIPSFKIAAENSQVVAWLIDQPEIADYIKEHNIPADKVFETFKPCFIYDKATRTWGGVNNSGQVANN